MRMKKYVMTLALCIAAGVMLTLPVQADAKSTGKLTKNIKWSLNSDETVLTITGKGTVDIRKFRKEGRYKWPGSEAGQPAIFVIFDNALAHDCIITAPVFQVYTL